MNRVRIVADNGCDLSPAVAAELEITLVPVYVRFGEDMVSSDQLTSDDFWARAGDAAEHPGTSSPAPATFYRVFEKLVNAGHDVVCMTLPGRQSGTFNAAWLAGQEFGQRVSVFDTGSFSLGMGLQVLAAAREALAGRSAEAIQGLLENLRSRTSVIFVLDTLEWVRRGGRLDLLLPLIDRIARTLHVKPIIEMCNGEFRLVGVARSYRSALQRVDEEVRSRLPVESVAAVYTRGRETAFELVSRLASAVGVSPGEILTTEAGPAFAAHAGPNAVGAAVVRT